MSRYTGLSAQLSTAVRTRDRDRCRWCGRTDQHTDLHHIRYRRGYVDDVEDNLISLCRSCHDFVHGWANARGQSILKETAQLVLNMVVERPGRTGLSQWRQLKATWTRTGCCEHGNAGACYPCAQLTR